MQKVILIIICGLLLTGCSVFRKEKSILNPIQKGSADKDFYDDLQDNNLSAGDFYLRKAEVEIKRGNEKERLLVSWKYKANGNSLISIRTRAGLEVSRVFITRDTLIVNDRINRIIFFGKPVFLKRKYGLPTELLPIIIGDYIKGSGEIIDELKCIGGKANFDTSVRGVRTEYIADCRKRKIVGTDLYDGVRNKALEIRFGDFVRRNEIIYPARIFMKYYSLDAEVDIKIDKIEYPWEGNINFIPGRGYDKKSLN